MLRSAILLSVVIGLAFGLIAGAFVGAGPAVAVAGGVGLLAFLLLHIWRGMVEAASRKCAGCGYDLSGLPRGGKCPECGTAAGR